MIQIAHLLVFAGGAATGFIGVVLVTAGRPQRSLLPPPPIPAPAPAPSNIPPVQNLTALPGGSSKQVLTGASTRTDRVADSGRSTWSTAVPPLPPPVTPAISGTLRDHSGRRASSWRHSDRTDSRRLTSHCRCRRAGLRCLTPNVPDARLQDAADRLGNSVYTSNAAGGV